MAKTTNFQTRNPREEISHIEALRLAVTNKNKEAGIDKKSGTGRGKKEHPPSRKGAKVDRKKRV